MRITSFRLKAYAAGAGLAVLMFVIYLAEHYATEVKTVRRLSSRYEEVQRDIAEAMRYHRRINDRHVELRGIIGTTTLDAEWRDEMASVLRELETLIRHQGEHLHRASAHPFPPVSTAPWRYARLRDAYIRQRTQWSILAEWVEVLKLHQDAFEKAFLEQLNEYHATDRPLGPRTTQLNHGDTP